MELYKIQMTRWLGVVIIWQSRVSLAQQYHRIWQFFHIFFFILTLASVSSSQSSPESLGLGSSVVLDSIAFSWSQSNTLLFSVLLTTLRSRSSLQLRSLTRADVEGTRKNQTLLNSAWLSVPIRLRSVSSSKLLCFSGNGCFFWTRHLDSLLLKLSLSGLEADLFSDSSLSCLFLVGSLRPEGPLARDLLGLFKFSDTVRLSSWKH